MVVAWIRLQGAEPMNSAPVFHKSGVAWWFFRGHPVNNGGSCSGVALRAILTPLTQPCCWRIYHHYNCCRPQSMLIVYFNMETYYWLDAPRFKPPSVIHISSPYPPVILHFRLYFLQYGWVKWPFVCQWQHQRVSFVVITYLFYVSKLQGFTFPEFILVQNEYYNCLVAMILF